IRRNQIVDVFPGPLWTVRGVRVGHRRVVRLVVVVLVLVVVLLLVRVLLVRVLGVRAGRIVPAHKRAGVDQPGRPGRGVARRRLARGGVAGGRDAWGGMAGRTGENLAGGPECAPLPVRWIGHHPSAAHAGPRGDVLGALRVAPHQLGRRRDLPAGGPGELLRG